MALSMYCYDCLAPVSPGLPVCLNCANPPAIAPGTVLHGTREDYTVECVLGKGAMGLAYKTRDPFGVKVVVKQMIEDPDPTTHADNLRLFQREAQIQRSISHPRFPEGYGYFLQDGSHFMAMEFIPGQDLEKVLAASPSKRLDEETVLMIGVQVSEGIVALHEFTDSMGNPTPIIHRDIKPGNIVQKPNGEVVILDFGISRPENLSTATQNRNTSRGTPEYMSKEQLLGIQLKQNDLYSIAASMYHLVLGGTLDPVFPNRPAMVNNLPSSWLPVFRRALADEAKDRQADVREFHDDLRSLLPPALRNTVAPMVQTTTPSGRPQIQLNLGPLAQNLGWLIIGLLLATIVVAWILTKPLIWKSALGVLVVIGLVKAGQEISKHVTANKMRQVGHVIAWPFRMLWWLICQPIRGIRWVINWFSGLNLPVISILGYLLFAACVALAWFGASHRDMTWFSLAFIMGILVLSLMSAIRNPGFLNRLLTMLSAFAAIAWLAFKYF